MPESDASAPLAREAVAEFPSAPVGAAAVVVDIRRAGEVNKRTINVVFQFAHALAAIGARRALCGTADFKQIWELCRGDTVCQLYEDIGDAYAAVGGV